MNHPQDRPTRSKQPVAVLLTIALHFALAYFLYTQAVKASESEASAQKQEMLQAQTP